MKVELHCHTSRYSACAVNTPQELMREFIRTGYEAVYITEHRALWSEFELDELRGEFPQLKIFPGIEWTVSDDPVEHVLILGATNPAYPAMTSWRECQQLARAEGHLTVLAHPFRWQRAADVLGSEHLPDAIEYRTCNQQGAAARSAMEAANCLGLPIINAGDTHGLGYVNRFYIQTAQPIAQADDIRKIVLAGEYRNEGQE